MRKISLILLFLLSLLALCAKNSGKSNVSSKKLQVVAIRNLKSDTVVYLKFNNLKTVRFRSSPDYQRFSGLMLCPQPKFKTPNSYWAADFENNQSLCDNGNLPFGQHDAKWYDSQYFYWIRVFTPGIWQRINSEFWIFKSRDGRRIFLRLSDKY